ncbi:hypothetical protein D3C80_1959800 [compost metagenome]
MAADRAKVANVVTAPLLASNGIIATSGIAAISWNNRAANALRPIGDGVRLRSLIACMAIAVEDNASVRPISSATFQSSPRK